MSAVRRLTEVSDDAARFTVDDVLRDASELAAEHGCNRIVVVLGDPAGRLCTVAGGTRNGWEAVGMLSEAIAQRLGLTGAP